MRELPERLGPPARGAVSRASYERRPQKHPDPRLVAFPRPAAVTDEILVDAWARSAQIRSTASAGRVRCPWLGLGDLLVAVAVGSQPLDVRLEILLSSNTPWGYGKLELPTLERQMAATTPATTPTRGYSATKDQLIKRLRRLEGQVRGVERMVEEDRYCIDVLTQISAIQAALDKVALGVLNDHAEHCIVHGTAAATPEENVEELMGAVARLMRRG